MDDKTKENRALQAVLTNPQKFPRDFYDWLRQNWHIYEYFQRSADQVWLAGYRHYSARTIAEVMRHRTALREIGDGTWKINNNRIPSMARLYMLMNPERAGFFHERDNSVTVAQM